MTSDISSFTDWVKIKIKFSGLCLNCKRKINTGDFGYWSRSSKSIIHENCYLLLISNNDENNHEELINNNYSRSMHKNNNDRKLTTLAKNQRCFICNNRVNIQDPLIISLTEILDKYDPNESIYCTVCMKGFNSRIFREYRAAFQRKFR